VGNLSRQLIIVCGLYVVGHLFVLAPVFAQDEPKTKPAPQAESAIRATQVALVLDTNEQRSRFQGSVLNKGKNSLLVLTAAHCLSVADVGKTIRISRGEKSLAAQISAVIQNPYYRESPLGDSPGADNAVALFQGISKVDQESALFRELQTADVTEWPLPDSDRQPIYARIRDQFGKEHIIRAGNYSNPKWLEWGPSYRPLPGDSGSGVFVFPRTGNGNPSRPTIIGVVVDRSDLGGGASLLSRRNRWLVEAMQTPVNGAEKKETARDGEGSR
jgi:hypothetical protein